MTLTATVTACSAGAVGGETGGGAPLSCVVGTGVEIDVGVSSVTGAGAAAGPTGALPSVRAACVSRGGAGSVTGVGAGALTAGGGLVVVVGAVVGGGALVVAGGAVVAGGVVVGGGSLVVGAGAFSALPRCVPSSNTIHRMKVEVPSGSMKCERNTPPPLVGCRAVKARAIGASADVNTPSTTLSLTAPLIVLPSGARIESVGCAAALAEYREHGLGLIGIDEVVRDGRDHRARLVRARITRDGKEAAVQIRVESHGGAWRMATL